MFPQFSSLRRFTLQRILSLALILILLAGMLPMPDMALAADGVEDQMTPGLRAAIQEALGPDAFAPAVEAAKLTASDGAAGDLFGYSVALSGDTALVGSIYDEDNGDNSGSAYIFERNQGGTDNWGQVKKLLPSDGAAWDIFGKSVTLSGDTALVGAQGDSDNGNDSGSAYIFERDQGGTDNWGQVKKLLPSDGAAFCYFGKSVVISGDTVLVGARGDESGQYSGSAYIFERDQGEAGNWGQVSKLTASDTAAGGEFGNSVALSGDTALVGAYEDSAAGYSAGSAYIFERDQGGAGNWGQVKKLIASDIDNWDRFGSAVALSGDTALIGSKGDDHHGHDSGSAYIFERNQGGANNWGETAKIMASDDNGQDGFSSSVALSGDTALLGSPGNDDDGGDSGSVYFFERNQGGVGAWGEVTKLTASDGAAGDRFGASVALSENTALVGAFGDDDNGSSSGSAYIYYPYLENGGFEDPLGAEWTEVVTANGDGRIPLAQAYEGGYLYFFKADGGLEVINQTVAQSGVAGDEYTLTFYFGGKNVDLSGKLGARLTFYNGGVKVNKNICIFTPPSATFSWAAVTCTITAAGAFDSIEISIGILNVPSGKVGVDAAILNKTGP